MQMHLCYNICPREWFVSHEPRLGSNGCSFRISCAVISSCNTQAVYNWLGHKCGNLPLFQRNVPHYHHSKHEAEQTQTGSIQ